MEEKDKDIVSRTEEVRDIIDRMPHRTGKIVALCVAGFTVLLLFFGWIIDYPEKVSGPVSIVARQAPTRLVANVPGKLHILRANNEPVKEKEVLAFIENPASLSDVLLVEKYLVKYSFEFLHENRGIEKLPGNLYLGDLGQDYFVFLNALQQLERFRSDQPYFLKEKSLMSLLTSQEKLKMVTEEQLKTDNASLKVAKSSLKRDSVAFEGDAVSAKGLETSMMNFLRMVESNQAMEKEIATIEMQINDTRHKLSLLATERNEAEQKHLIDLFAGYSRLRGSIEKWKQAYTLSAPFAGTIEYLNFWHENDFIAAGTPVVSVMPSDNTFAGQIYLPAQGAGKVKAGQEVIIRLDNFPYIEFGSITGRVLAVSALANPTEGIAPQGKLNTYLVTVDLPGNLITNYGATLAVTQEVKGTADILTKKRKLLERLFDNLKYIASKK